MAAGQPTGLAGPLELQSVMGLQGTLGVVREPDATSQSLTALAAAAPGVETATAAAAAAAIGRREPGELLGWLSSGWSLPRCIIASCLPCLSLLWHCVWSPASLNPGSKLGAPSRCQLSFHGALCALSPPCGRPWPVSQLIWTGVMPPMPSV